jgi:hemoglobin
MKLILRANRSGTLTLAWKAAPGRRLTRGPSPMPSARNLRIPRSLQRIARWFLPVVLVILVGCRAGPAGTKRDEFTTSGSREADQRASQKMAKAEQLSGSGEGSGERGVRKEKASGGSTNDIAAAQVQDKLALFDRLGGERGLEAIVEDFIPRVLNDPRVNWARTGNTRAKFFKRDKSEAWTPTPENVARIKKHFVQFLALATGGPAVYEGNEMKAVHSGMRVTNPEFDAVVGDLKVTLDRLRIPNKEQRELLAIIESTRPQIVTER